MKIALQNDRVVTISIELEAFKTVIRSGKKESELYNLVVTVLDAKPYYLQNNIFSGEVVYNKNNETLAHFILRLKSLKKALPANNLAKVSKTSISNPSKSVKSQNSEDAKGAMKADRGVMSAERKVAKNKKTGYNEYRTNAMQLAKSFGRSQDDRAIFLTP